jgi:ATP-dependent helicase/nuclease subunit B
MLKIKRSTNDDALYIGNLFHECLNRLLEVEKIDDVDSFLDRTINQYLVQNNKKPTKKEIFFINKYKSVLKRLYDNLLKQKENSDFNIFGLEKEFQVILNKKYKVILNGKIDKVLTLEINGERYAIVLDYKSGNPDIDLNRIIYGLNMQIMFYFYFLNNYSNERYHFAGGYLQGVLPTSEFNRDTKLTYEEQFVNHFKLIGYSNLNHNILRKIDHNYDNDEKFLYGIKLNKDQTTFTTYSYQRLISEEDFWKLLSLVEQKINEAIDCIICGKFEINPKKLGTFNSCSFCPYLDLCYRNDSDYQKLEEYKNFDFIKEKV